MKNLKLFSVFTLFICFALFQSCGSDACKDVNCLNDGVCVDGTCDCPEGFSGTDCGTTCNNALFGTWNVTMIQPIGCTLLSYDFGTGTASNIISVSLDDGTNIFTGSGLVDSDCKAMTYSVSGSGLIHNGSITFDGSMLLDMSDLGCLITAVKQ